MSQKLVSVNEFVLRQTPGSGKTYAIDWSFEAIAEHAEKQLLMGKYRPGYRDGVVLVSVDPEFVTRFVCPYTKIDENTPLTATCVRRRENEQPYIQIRAKQGKQLKAGKVDLILYSHDVLAENDEFSTDAAWELISMHAVPQGVDSMPMGPVTMMRNQLELEGGTAAHYDSDEWAESVAFWQQYAAIEPEDEI